MVKRLLLGFAALSLAGLFVFVDAAPSGAVMEKGNCTGSGTFKLGRFTVTQAETKVIEVLAKDEVSWQGALPAKPAAPEAYHGKIEVALPPPFAPLSIDSWSGTSDSQGSDGVKKYDIPKWVPRNVELEVRGEHVGSTTCKGHVKIRLNGSLLDSPVGPASLVLTALSGAGFVLAGLPKKGR